jgi:hypothetical protein
MISELTLARVGGLGLDTLAWTIHPYPTQAEAVKRVGDAYNGTRLTPLVKGLFQKWLAWTRQGAQAETANVPVLLSARPSQEECGT